MVFTLLLTLKMPKRDIAVCSSKQNFISEGLVVASVFQPDLTCQLFSRRRVLYLLDTLLGEHSRLASGDACVGSSGGIPPIPRAELAFWMSCAYACHVMKCLPFDASAPPCVLDALGSGNQTTLRQHGWCDAGQR